MRAPEFKIEIIHIDGPNRGTIQEFYENSVTIGRHPDCHVSFPADMTTISRMHAEIQRDGNRFILSDTSTNGTQVNGKKVKETVLKDGDVLTIAEDGPKISFLATRLQPEELEEIRNRPEKPAPPPPIEQDIAPAPLPSSGPEVPLPEEKDITETGQEPDTKIEETDTPLTIQFGATIKSYSRLPITIGSSPDCDFPISQGGLMPQQARVSFGGGTYRIEDLSGKGMVSINGRPVTELATLPPDTCVALSSDGPFFQFLGDGRLAEIEMSGQEPSAAAKQAKPTQEHKSFWPFKK